MLKNKKIIGISLAVLFVLSVTAAAVSARPDPNDVNDGKPSVISNPASSNNFKESNRGGGDIQWIVIHDIEGSYSSGINTFKDPNSKVSAHFVISKDGEITQMVSDGDIAYHAGNYPYNEHSIGIELEGYADKPDQFTEQEYTATANLVKWLCQQYDIPLVHYSGVAPADPTAGKGIIGHYQVPNPSDATKGGGISGHTDPGEGFKWESII